MMTKAQFMYLLQNLSSIYKIGLSDKQKKDIWCAMRNEKPILFIGEGNTGKTVLAKELQKYGITAYAPEMVSTILLGDKKPKDMREITGLTQLSTYE